MCLICTLSAALYQNAFRIENVPYLGISYGDFQSPEIGAVLTFFLAMIAFQNIIPIALYISIDIAKTFQSYFIYSDIQMYDEITQTPAVCQSWKLCDDLGERLSIKYLGQIEYIFSDKTGTLTSNQMELKQVSIDGVVYGKCYSKEEEEKRIQDQKLMMESFSKLYNPIYLSKEMSFIDATIHANILEKSSHSVRIREFFVMLALCHTVLTDIDSENPNNIVYKAQSPDEAALVLAAKDAGFAFLKRHKDILTLNIFGDARNYELLKVMEFNSFRKRMSVIIKRPEGEILLICKGADSVILERLQTDTDPIIEEKTRTHLEDFANNG